MSWHQEKGAGKALEFHPNKCHKSAIRYAFDCRDETSGPSN